jgi:hypothetical protein
MVEIVAALAGLALLGIVQAAHTAAGPKVGERFPSLEGKDLDAKGRELASLVVEEPTLIVAITERAGEKGMQAWFDKSDTLAPRMIRRVAIVSIDMPFFVSDGMARAEARGKTPEGFYGRMLLDTSSKMARRLGLEKNDTPYVWVVDRQGTVLAAFHGRVNDPGADGVWQRWPGT